jgi:flagellar export protein FliJ
VLRLFSPSSLGAPKPRFEFPLEGVLRHRKNTEQQRQRELAVLQLQMQHLQTDLRQLDNDAQSSTADVRINHLIGTLDLNYLAAHRRFIVGMQRRAIVLAQKMALLQRQVDDARLALGEAAKARKAIEKLREQQYERFVYELNKRDADAMDEIGMQLSYRQLQELRSEEQTSGGES